MAAIAEAEILDDLLCVAASGLESVFGEPHVERLSVLE